MHWLALYRRMLLQSLCCCQEYDDKLVMIHCCDTLELLLFSHVLEGSTLGTYAAGFAYSTTRWGRNFWDASAFCLTGFFKSD